jgi:hypothetical protein
MRDPKRLDSFYEYVREMHETYFPEKSFAYLMLDLIFWYSSIEKRDIFFPEEDDMKEIINKYVEYRKAEAKSASVSLYRFYESIKNIHQFEFPDWRFGQLMYNFFDWVYANKTQDIKNVSNDEIIDMMAEFGGKKNNE